MTLHELLQRRFDPERGWRLLPEFTAPSGQHRADFVAVNVWRSRGLLLHGVEVKSARSDWLKELKRPDKADDMFRYCDHWWLLVTDTNIVKDGELPEGWGLLVASDKTLRAKVDAPRLSPEPWPRMLSVRLLLAAETLVQRRYTDDHSKSYSAGLRVNAEAADTARKTLYALQDEVRAFEQRTGMSIRKPDPEITSRLDAARALESMRRGLRFRGIKAEAARLRRLADEIDSVEKKLLTALVDYTELGNSGKNGVGD